MEIIHSLVQRPFPTIHAEKYDSEWTRSRLRLRSATICSPFSTKECSRSWNGLPHSCVVCRVSCVIGWLKFSRMASKVRLIHVRSVVVVSEKSLENESKGFRSVPIREPPVTSNGRGGDSRSIIIAGIAPAIFTVDPDPSLTATARVLDRLTGRSSLRSQWKETSSTLSEWGPAFKGGGSRRPPRGGIGASGEIFWSIRWRNRIIRPCAMAWGKNSPSEGVWLSWLEVIVFDIVYGLISYSRTLVRYFYGT